MSQILVLHGPNLNLLGSREPEVYGHETLEDINQSLIERGQMAGCVVRCEQRNAEHELLSEIHAAAKAGVDYIIINPAALTHTSVALRDALLGGGHPLYRGALEQCACARGVSAPLFFVRCSRRRHYGPGFSRIRLSITGSTEYSSLSSSPQLRHSHGHS